MDPTFLIWGAAIFLLLCFFAMCGWFIWFFKQYKHPVVAFRIAGGMVSPLVTKARLVWDKTRRVHYYRVMKVPPNAREMQAPPDYAIFPLAAKNANLIVAFHDSYASAVEFTKWYEPLWLWFLSLPSVLIMPIPYVGTKVFLYYVVYSKEAAELEGRSGNKINQILDTSKDKPEVE